MATRATRIRSALGMPAHRILMLSLVVLLSLCTPNSGVVSSLLFTFSGVGNLSQSQVLPQCQTQCDAYNVMNTQCNAVGVFDITYIYCECTPTNFDIIESCFNCQAVNATQEAVMQQLLDDIVDECNNKIIAPDSTVTISSQKIMPSSSSTASSTPSQSNDAVRWCGFGLLALSLAALVFGLS
ncbi:hypothetical protein FB45DRAFT_898071 [Roridomyces roridus]|uniref:Uncharacterized protein n=1 Tax=Roridomyces roridus TaxID=1738132 RepID=A0AAD7CC79_9AGAR|nr:hypothetical protein FB45DRAFT_898071 [Roridomyces roridus]